MSQSESQDSSSSEIRQIAIEFDNAQLFDIHRWSDYQEVNNAISFLYTELSSLPKFNKNKSLRKKHIKVLVLDLYVKWLQDPKLYTSIYRRKAYYDDLHSRYNALHISRLTIDVLNALIALEYVIQPALGYRRDYKGKARLTRIRASEKLISLIKEQYQVKPEMIELAHNTECIILRKYIEDKKKQIDFAYEDSDDQRIAIWRLNLYAYNNLLRRTYIDIPSCPITGILTRSRDGKVIRISQHEKFVRRIFNENWDSGGRFYGGWWQRIPSDWRMSIRIGVTPVSEADFSGLHIVLLYAISGISYREDPYQLTGYEHSDRLRDLLKEILLSAINAESELAATRAIQKKINLKPDEYGWINESELNLKELINAFTIKHTPIREYFFSGSGIKLQNLDSIIAEKVINHFTEKSIPVLCVHDSFVIANNHLEELKMFMQTAFIDTLTEIGINLEHESKINLEGLRNNQFRTILSDPQWHELRDAFVRERYEYPEWYENLQNFQQKVFFDYYKP